MLGVLLLGPAGLEAAAPSVRLEFAAGEASARTFQPLRLTVDLPGPPRSIVARLVLPPGARTVRPVDRIDVGGGQPRTYLFNVYVPEGVKAGDFVVTGEVRDDSRVWPLHATLRVRADPMLRVGRQNTDAIVVGSNETATGQFAARNVGNVPLHLKIEPQPNSGLETKIWPTELTLDPGSGGTFDVTARSLAPGNTLFETSLFASVEARSADFVQRETIGLDFAFVPERPDPGSLYAELDGEVVPGALVEDNQDGSTGFAGRFTLSGDITAHTRLEMSGADGRASAAGSRIGLADRDFARVALQGPWGTVAGGLVTPPLFGVLEPSTQGRGGLAEKLGTQWSLGAFATRDTYPGFARENFGIQLRQPDGPWEFGALAQKNQSDGTPDARRIGGYAQWHWIREQFDSSTQLAVADIDTDSYGARFAGEERLSWRRENFSLDGTLQLAEEGFDLAGRSSRESNGTFSWRHDPWLWYARGVSSKDDGALETEMQRRRDLGEELLEPEVVELTTRETSERHEWEIGVGREMSLGRFELSGNYTDYSTALNPADDYQETSGTLSWTRGLTGTFAQINTTVGRENTAGASTDFAELELNFSGEWRYNLGYAVYLRQDWNWNGFSTGLRRPGLYGQISFSWQRRPNSWRAETGVNIYNYDQLPSSSYAYAVLEMPVSRRFNLGVEVNVDANGGPGNAWVYLRMPFKVPLPWRPIHGALVGRVNDGHGGGLPGALADLGGGHAITASDGRFALPALPPGRYPLKWRMPGGWTEGSDWPAEVELRAGEREFVELGAQQLAVLRGTAIVRSETPDAEPRKLSGVVRATDENGRLFETLVTDGEFQLGLPPGRYRVRFLGYESNAVAAQLDATVVINPGDSEVTVGLEAVETRRKMRQTLFIEGGP